MGVEDNENRSNFGWKDGLEFAQEERKSGWIGKLKIPTAILLAASVFYAGFSMLMLDSAVEDVGDEPVTCRLIQPDGLQANNSYAAAKQLHDYINLVSIDYAKSLMLGERIECKDGIAADIGLLFENLGERGMEYYASLSGNAIMPLFRVSIDVEPRSGLFGLGKRAKGDVPPFEYNQPKTYFTVGMKKDELFRACMAMEVGHNEDLRRSCAYVITLNEKLWVKGRIDDAKVYESFRGTLKRRW